MRIYPAIDLMRGRVVRLHQGNPSMKITYDRFGAPTEVAREWEAQGADILHVIDLDAALGIGDNLSIIEKIVRGVDIPVQVGGGYRSEAKVKEGFDLGIDRIILGSLTLKHPDVVINIGKTYGFDRIVVSLDYRNNAIGTDGWQVFENITVNSVLHSYREKGVCSFLLTSIERDGSLRGPDPELGRIFDKLSDIIVAGGVSSLSDIEILREFGFEGAVLGRVLYESVINLADAIKMGRGSI